MPLCLQNEDAYTTQDLYKTHLGIKEHPIHIIYEHTSILNIHLYSFSSKIEGLHSMSEKAFTYISFHRNIQGFHSMSEKACQKLNIQLEGFDSPTTLSLITWTLHSYNIVSYLGITFKTIFLNN